MARSPDGAKRYGNPVQPFTAVRIARSLQIAIPTIGYLSGQRCLGADLANF
jgi:hypothetical protein